jgi:hypothetical protein
VRAKNREREHREFASAAGGASLSWEILRSVPGVHSSLGLLQIVLPPQFFWADLNLNPAVWEATAATG